MALKIEETRYSLIWAETTVDHFYSDVLEDTSSDFLAWDFLYEREFEEAVAGRGPEGWGTPWPYPYGQNFWEEYLDGARLESLPGERARKSMVPFSRPLPSLRPDWLDGRIGRRLFLHPHGLALAVTLRASPGADLSETVRLLLRAATDRLEIGHPAGARQMTLSSLADDTLTRWRREIFGNTSRAGARTSVRGPFLVFATLQATGLEGSSGNVDEELHRALDALARCEPPRPEAKLPALEERRLPAAGQSRFPDQVVYGTRRGRAVWLPQWITPDAGTANRVSCYQNNLVFASVQVESLGHLMSEVVARLASDELPKVLDDYARLAAGILGRMYGGSRSIYRTWSARSQIEDNFLADTNTVRRKYGMSALGSREGD